MNRKCLIYVFFFVMASPLAACSHHDDEMELEPGMEQMDYNNNEEELEIEEAPFNIA